MESNIQQGSVRGMFKATETQMHLRRTEACQPTAWCNPVPYTAWCNPVPYTAWCNPVPCTAWCNPVPYTAWCNPVPCTAWCNPVPCTAWCNPVPYTAWCNPVPYMYVSGGSTATEEGLATNVHQPLNDMCYRSGLL